MKKTKKAVILLSGGLDSTTCLAIAINEGYQIHALTINYGQKQNYELSAAKNIVKKFNVAEHSVIDIDLTQFGGSALTDNIDVPKNQNIEEMRPIPITYVPARNTIFLSIALAKAETINANYIFIGVNALDYSGYPDCRPEFIKAFEKTANLGTKNSVENKEYFRIKTPLIDLKKSEIIEKGLSLNIDYGDTSTCYEPNKHGWQCKECDACILRLKGFESLGLEDPVKYQ